MPSVSGPSVCLGHPSRGHPSVWAIRLSGPSVLGPSVCLGHPSRGHPSVWAIRLGAIRLSGPSVLGPSVCLGHPSVWAIRLGAIRLSVTSVCLGHPSRRHPSVYDIRLGDTDWWFGSVVMRAFTLSGNCNVWTTATKGWVTALRKKAKEERLGGRRYGALIANSCDVLQSYYRNAITKNLGKSDSMREAIMASFFHCMSSDESPLHQKCPQGPDSWCFCNKAVANGQDPPKHKDHVGTTLSQDVARAVRPVYERMSDPSLLERIQHGRTQNANECLNGQIWARCPKTVHVGTDRVNAAVASAVSNLIIIILITLI